MKPRPWKAARTRGTARGGPPADAGISGAGASGSERERVGAAATACASRKREGRRKVCGGAARARGGRDGALAWARGRTDREQNVERLRPPAHHALEAQRVILAIELAHADLRRGRRATVACIRPSGSHDAVPPYPRSFRPCSSPIPTPPVALLLPSPLLRQPHLCAAAHATDLVHRQLAALEHLPPYLLLRVARRLPHPAPFALLVRAAPPAQPTRPRQLLLVAHARAAVRRARLLRSAANALRRLGARTVVRRVDRLLLDEQLRQLQRLADRLRCEGRGAQVGMRRAGAARRADEEVGRGKVASGGQRGATRAPCAQCHMSAPISRL